MTAMPNPTAFGKVAVMFGGSSAERPVSLKSGAAVADALEQAGVDVLRFDPAERRIADLPGLGVERVFIALHGRGGEDGVMQGALEQLGLPYTGSGVLGSALGMDKIRCKRLWQGLGLPTPEYFEVSDSRGAEAAAEAMRTALANGAASPMIVKPAHEGSSIGMARVETPAQLLDACAAATRFDQEVLVERWITGAEYTAAMLGDQALPLIRLETDSAFYDYEAKYLSDSTRYFCPCGLDAEQETRFQSLCQQAFRAVGASGWGRVDFMVDASGHPWLLEVNTAPGMTDHSLVPMAAKTNGIDFPTLCLAILAQTLPTTRSEA